MDTGSVTTSLATHAKARVLVAEDDEPLARFMSEILRESGYEVDCITEGPPLLGYDFDAYDLLLLDLNFGGLDGLDVLRQLRSRSSSVPVLVVTGRSRAAGLLPALEAGADDCLLKPFSYLELLARVRVLLRRFSVPLLKTSRCSDLILHRENNFVKRGERRVELTQREFALLEYLMRTPEVPVSRATLQQAVWGENCQPSTNIVDVYMKYVRDKVDLPGLPKLVRTVRGTGYMVSSAA